MIAVDAGKHTTKAMGGGRTFKIRTTLSDSMMLGEAHAVEYNGKRYVLGTGEYDFDISKTKLCHKLTTYVSVAMLAQAKDVDLVIGCPITQFVNREAREEHAEYFKGSVQIKIDGQWFSFTVNNVLVLPETLGAVMQNPSEYMNSIIGVIDIGGLNVNGAIYDHLRPVKSSVFSVNGGGNIIMANIKRALNTATLANYQDYEIPHLKENKIKDEVLNSTMESIIAESKKYNWNIGQLPLIFTGGGSLLLEKQIKARNWTISKNPVWDNVQGFLKYAEVYK